MTIELIVVLWEKFCQFLCIPEQAVPEFLFGSHRRGALCARRVLLCSAGAFPFHFHKARPKVVSGCNLHCKSRIETWQRFPMISIRFKNADISFLIQPASDIENPLGQNHEHPKVGAWTRFGDQELLL